MNDMEYTDKEYCLEVWGDWACFTRPELKVERVSYDVITPSAARAIFEAILFKRYAMRWQITKIEVLRPIKWATIRRNEVGAVASTLSVKTDTTSTIEKYHFSFSSSHTVRTLRSSNNFNVSFFVISVSLYH